MAKCLFCKSELPPPKSRGAGLKYCPTKKCRYFANQLNYFLKLRKEMRDPLFEKNQRV